MDGQMIDGRFVLLTTVFIGYVRAGVVNYIR